MMDIVREAVSKKKRRFKEDGFNLDLSYISLDVMREAPTIDEDYGGETEGQLIAMGFPAQRFEATYRNNIADVLSFLEQRHAQQYRVYNLCTERKYRLDSFPGTKVIDNFGFRDHNPPPFSYIHQFCVSVQEYIEANPKNVAVIHCKAGKGRTGVMICCFLIYWLCEVKRCWTPGRDPCTERALKHFSRQRTLDSRGVTIPSQKRYVEFYEVYLGAKLRRDTYLIQQNSYFMIQKICITSLNSGPWYFQLNTSEDNKQVDSRIDSSIPTVEYRLHQAPEHKGIQHVWSFAAPIVIKGDFNIKFYRKKDQIEFMFWFNTMFLHPEMCKEGNQYHTFKISSAPDKTRSVQLRRVDCDKICKSKYEKHYPRFMVKCTFAPISSEHARNHDFKYKQNLSSTNSRGQTMLDRVYSALSKLSPESAQPQPQLVQSTSHQRLMRHYSDPSLRSNGQPGCQSSATAAAADAQENLFDPIDTESSDSGSDDESCNNASNAALVQSDNHASGPFAGRATSVRLPRTGLVTQL